MAKRNINSESGSLSAEPSFSSEGATARSSSWLTVFLALVIAAVTFVIYLPLTQFPFLAFDDDQAVYANPHLTTPGYFWLHSYFRLYTPVTYTFYSIIGALYKLPQAIATPTGGTSHLSPVAYHGANLVFHTMNVVLAYVLIRMLLPRASGAFRDVAAAAGALVFALYPMQVEPVAWVNAANNVFTGFFALIALICYVRSAQVTPDRSKIFIAAATVSYILAVLSKPTAVALPLMAWGIDYGILRRPLRQSAPLLIWVAIGILMIPITLASQPPGHAITPTAIWFRPFIAGEALSFYLQKLVYPVPLSIDYGLNPTFMRQHTHWELFWCIPVAAILLVWMRRKQWPVVVAAGVIYLAWLLPTVGLVPSYYHLISVVADRYPYLAMLGPALAIAWLVNRYRYAPLILCVPLLAFWAYRVTVQETYWKDMGTLMGHAVDVSPDGWFAQTNYATWQDRRGDGVEALPHAEAVVRLNPAYPTGHFNLGILLMELNDNEGAAKELQIAATMDTPPPMDQFSEYESDRMDLAEIALHYGRRDDAVAQLQDILQYARNFQPALTMLTAINETAPAGGHTNTQQSPGTH